MANEITFGFTTGNTLTYVVYTPAGAVRTSSTPLPEIGSTGYYTESDANIQTKDFVIVYRTGVVVGQGEYQPELATLNEKVDDLLDGQDDIDTSIAVVNTKVDQILEDTGTTIPNQISALNDFDPTSDAVANVTLVGTTTTNTDMRGTDNATVGKTGYSLASDGLDSVSITEPTGVASNFREMLVQTWRRFYKKSKMTPTSLTTYKDDGTTVATTQALAETDTLQTMEAST